MKVYTYWVALKSDKFNFHSGTFDTYTEAENWRKSYSPSDREVLKVYSVELDEKIIGKENFEWLKRKQKYIYKTIGGDYKMMPKYKFITDAGHGMTALSEV